MSTIDTRGKLCPLPLIMTKKAIETLPEGETVEVISDNVTAKENLEEYLSQMGVAFSVKSSGVEYIFTFSVPSKSVEPLEAEPFCRPASHYSVVIKSELMGSGDDELGALLMRGFINSIHEVDQLPSHVILYNGGVKLAVSGVDTCESLKALESKGVTILLCGTCLDFYGLKEKIGVGVIGNMFKISEITTASSKVIYP